jgi:hypothetical protein
LEFVAHCPPVRAILISICVGQYQWGVKGPLAESTYKAGALDLFMSAYLPYCNRFVTKDSGQYHALTVVAERAGLPTGVYIYDDFRNALMVS